MTSTNTPSEATTPPDKTALRRALRARRREIKPGTARAAGLAITQYLDQLPCWQTAKIVAAYLPHQGEVDPGPIIEQALQAGKQTVCPRVESPTALSFRIWRPGDPTELTAYGLPEPPRVAETVSLADIDLVFVPLLAWDSRGFRLGYGGGYYDRLLAGWVGYSCGLGYPWQQLDQHLPTEPHDRKLNACLTDSGLQRFGEGVQA